MGRLNLKLNHQSLTIKVNMLLLSLGVGKDSSHLRKSGEGEGPSLFTVDLDTSFRWVYQLKKISNGF